MAEAGVEAEVEVCLVMLWWITVPGHWRFLHLQRQYGEIEDCQIDDSSLHAVITFKTRAEAE
ncbi:hypothetical protein Celaphus_00016704, partial [Cervus elaphus hippelaphus]